ncbi:unnamed protein product, partial [Pylaiella littoralis]
EARNHHRIGAGATMKAASGDRMQAVGTRSELELKILLVGAPKSGKTSLVRRLRDKGYREEYVKTLGFDISVVSYGTYQGRPVNLHLWDVAGSQLSAQPCHHALIGQGAEGVMYVADVTSRESLQAVDDWDQALSKFLPPRTCKLLVGHKADLPAYVVNDEALSLYVASASGFKGWCLTVGSSEYGDYDVAARRGGGGGATADGGGRSKGQSLSGEKQLSVSEAVRTLLGHVFRAGGAGGDAARPAGVLGLSAYTGRATPLTSGSQDDALRTVDLLGLGSRRRRTPPDRKNEKDELLAATAGSSREDRDGSEGMKALLERGQGPGSSWRDAGAGSIDHSAAAAAAAGEGGADDEEPAIDGGGDPGWRYFAGRMGREEAEALLRGRPDGTFFLRRKGPSLLVLTYVALSKRPGANANTDTPGSGGSSGGGGGRQHRKSAPASRSPRRLDVLGSPRGEKPVGGGRGGLLGGDTDGVAGATSVQHALLVHEGGFFSDAKGRLGRFPTIELLLKSKISALARYPLSFRRERDRYVPVDSGETKSAAPSLRPNPRAASSSAPSSPLLSSFTAAVHGEGGKDTAGRTGVALRGGGATTVASLVPGIVRGGDPFALGAADEASVSPPPSPPPPPPPPRIDKPDNTMSRFVQSLQGRQRRSGASSSPASTTTTGAVRRDGGDWTDSRVTKNSDRANIRAGRGGTGCFPSDGGAFSSSSAAAAAAAAGGWLEAAAAVEKFGAVAVPAGEVALGKTTALVAGADNASARSQGGSLSSASAPGGASSVALQESIIGAISGGGVTLGPGSRKGLASSTDGGGGGGGGGGGSVASASSPGRANTVGVRRGSAAQQQRQNQWRQRGCGGGGDKASAMAEAAEAAEAMAVARGHPAARRVEERTLAAQADIDRAMASLEQQLRPLIARRASPHSHSPRRSSPTQSPRSSSSSTDKRRGRRVPASPPPASAFSSPRDSPISPDLSAPRRFLGREQPQQWWTAAVPEGSVTAPLVAAAMLLMERAWSRRQDLLGSWRKLRERAVDFAVAETTFAAGSRGDSRTSGGVVDGVAAAARGAAGNVGPTNSRSRSSSGGGSPLSPLSPSPFHMAGRQLFSLPAGPSVGKDSSGGNRILLERTGNQPFSTESISIGTGTAARLPAPSLAVDATETTKDGVGVVTTAAAVATDGGGLPGLSCCLDFERVLAGQEKEARPPPLLLLPGGEITPFVGNRDGVSVPGSPSVFPAYRYSHPASGTNGDGSMVAEYSYSGADQQSGGSLVADGVIPQQQQQQRELMPRGVAGASFFSAAAPPTDGWREIFRDVEIAEERSQEFEDIWKAAGGALRDACEDLAWGEND